MAMKQEESEMRKKREVTTVVCPVQGSGAVADK